MTGVQQVAVTAGKKALSAEQVSVARVSKLGVSETSLAEAGKIDVAAISEAEHWSPEALHRAADEVTGINGPETVALQNSDGVTVEWVSEAEASIYETAGLKSERVGENECLVRDDIDWNRKDAYGQTNLERAEAGYAPLDEKGQSYELHHVQQRNDGLLAELTQEEHRGSGNNEILHDRTGPSEIDRDAFNDVRKQYWQDRAAQVRGEMA